MLAHYPCQRFFIELRIIIAIMVECVKGKGKRKEQVKITGRIGKRKRGRQEREDRKDRKRETGKKREYKRNPPPGAVGL